MEALLKEILAELKKINEYIDIQKAQLVINIRDSVRLSRSSVKKESDEHKHIRRKCQQITFPEVLEVYRRYLPEEESECTRLVPNLKVSFGEIQSPSVEDIANKIKEILKEEIEQAANGC